MRTKLYRTCAINELLQSARETCKDEVMKTKKGLAEALGIGVPRLSNIEKGFSDIPLKLAIEWCDLTNAAEEKQAIMHIFGQALPPTDPRLLDTDKQLINFIKQAQDAIEAAKHMMSLQTNLRPWEQVNDVMKQEYIQMGKQVFDMKQATEALMNALDNQMSIAAEVEKKWIQQAVAKKIIVANVDSLLQVRKEQRYDETRFAIRTN